MFVEQPLALPGSAKYEQNVITCCTVVLLYWYLYRIQTASLLID